MVALLFALAGLAFMDSLDLLLIGVTAAVVVDSRLGRKSPLPGGLSFLAGVFAVTTAFGILTVLGIDFLTDLVDFELTPTIRVWGELAFGMALLLVVCLPDGVRAEPPSWTVVIRRRPWLLALLGVGIGLAQAPTAIPYLAGLAMIASRNPLPTLWPTIIVVYCALALVPPLLVLILATRRSRSAQRLYRRIVRGLAEYGPISVRVVFIVFAIGLIGDAALHYQHLW